MLVRDAEQAVAVANLVAPEHLELLMRDADELVHEVRHAGAVFVGVPTAIGDYVAGANHVLPTGGAARFSSALRVDDFRRHMHVIRATPEGLQAVGPGGGHAGARRGSGRPRRVGGTADRPMIRIEPRADLRELAGYHSPQLDVSVRLNTNESPYPPPPEFVDAWCRALAARTAAPLPGPGRRGPAGRHRRRGSASRSAGCSRPTGRTRCSRRCCSPTADPAGGPWCSSRRTRCTATSRASPAPRSSPRRVRDDFLIDPDHAVAVIEREQPDIVFVCSPNNPSGTVEPPSTVQAIVAAAPGPGDRRRGLRRVRAQSRRSRSSTTTPRSSSPAPTRRSGPSPRSGSGSRSDPRPSSSELDKVVLPYHLDVATQTAGVLALDHVDAMEGRVRHLIEERERLFVALDDLDGIEVFPSGANFLLFRAAGRGHALWAALVDDGILVRDFSSWPGVEDCLRVTVGTPEENDAFLTSLARALRESERS